MAADLPKLAVSLQEFIEQHVPWHRVTTTAHALMDGGLIVGARCVDCTQVYIEATHARKGRVRR